jgi:membrane protein required for colicin V production
VSWVDYVIMGVLFISALIGLVRGLISEVLSLVIWAVAFWAAWTFGPILAQRLEGSISLPMARIGIGYGVCFVGVLLVGGLFRFVISRLVASTGVGGPDRLFGMAFGAVRGVLIVSLVVFVLGFTPLPNEPIWRESALLPQFSAPAAWLGQQVPANVRQYMRPPEALQNMKMPNVSLPSSADLMKLRDLTMPGQAPRNINDHPAAATTTATQ